MFGLGGWIALCSRGRLVDVGGSLSDGCLLVLCLDQPSGC